MSTGLVRSEFIRSDIVDLIIDHHVRPMAAKLPDDEGRRARLCTSIRETLPRLLVNFEALEGYARFLEQFPSIRARHHEPPAGELTGRLLGGGVGALADEECAGLLLDPVALRYLSETIERELPEAWLRAVETDGRRLMREHGVEIPSIEQFLGRDPKIESGIANPMLSVKSLPDPSIERIPSTLSEEAARFTQDFEYEGELALIRASFRGLVSGMLDVAVDLKPNHEALGYKILLFRDGEEVDEVVLTPRQAQQIQTQAGRINELRGELVGSGRTERFVFRCQIPDKT